MTVEERKAMTDEEYRLLFEEMCERCQQKLDDMRIKIAIIEARKEWEKETK